MSSPVSHTVLREAAFSSGLLSQQQFDDAIAGLMASSPGDYQSPESIPEDVLGDRLVDLGYLNRWQVEQLKEGRTKFTLGPYRIVNAIGRGGMGHVFMAEHKLLGRVEAIKVLPKSKSTPEAIAAFQREIRAQAQLDHPNLVRVSYADFEGDTYFLVTEYVPGTDLRKLVRRNGPLPYTIAATIVSQAAEGLHYAHRRGLVHRDVKPGNLLVTPDGRTKITDLGLAWFLMEELENTRPAGRATSIVGTADYLAPESIREPSKIMPVSDVYALGCTLYYAVTAKVPFPGGTTSDKIRRHLDETPLNPLHFNPDLPQGFCDAIASMMEKNPSKRTPTAAAVVELLHPWRDESATRRMVEETPNNSKTPPRGERGAAGSSVPMDETAAYVLDDEFLPGHVDSPSQISQGTVSMAGETQETLPGLPSTRRRAPIKPSDDSGVSEWGLGRWAAVMAIGLLAAGILAWLVGLV